MAEQYKTYRNWAARDDSPFLCMRSQEEPRDQNGPLARTPFEHDRDRIIHSRAFRRLMHKTQIFNSKTNDHIRNRLTHTMEVYQIARGIGKPLGLNDALIEAIALGHDLGHTPFGHVGERTLHNILMGHSKRATEKSIPAINEGFKHNFQGLAILDNLEKGKQNNKGLNITLAVREGILKHTGCKMNVGENGDKEEVIYKNLNLEYLQVTEKSFTLEGQVVAIADEIAQCTHDLEDALRQRVIRISDLEDMPIVKRVRDKNPNLELNEKMNTNDIRMSLLYAMINELITDVYYASAERLNSIETLPTFEDEHSCVQEELIAFSPEVKSMTEKLGKTKTQMILRSREVSIEDSKAEYIIEQIFKAYYEHPMQLPTYILERYCQAQGKTKADLKISDLHSDPIFIRLICDHIGSMTDQHAEREFKLLYTPSY